MKKEKANSILSEVVDSKGFINLNNNDIEKFKADVNFLDSEKAFGKNEEVGIILDNAISLIGDRNNDKQMKKVLFVIRLPQENNFMEYVNNVYSVIDNLSEELECHWGISTIDNLHGDQLEVIVVGGF
jgi:cell division GTPase FtsZ